VAVKDQQIAALLAQEGTELVRNLRDNSWARGEKTFESFPLLSRSSCLVDLETTAISACKINSNNIGRRMFLDGNDFYRHNYVVGTPTKFYRKIGIAYDGSDRDDENTKMAVITSMVIWKNSNFPTVANCNTSTKCVYEQTTLTRWGEK
jgi:hypothetical protein